MYLDGIDRAQGLSDPSKALGGEAALWSEFINSDNLESRVWPRLGAVAEALWLPSAHWCPDTLEQRLAAMADRLQKHFALGGGSRTWASSNVKTLLAKGWAGGDESIFKCVANMVEPMGHFAR